jgi:protein tyrosine phosphatase (PTP) superfamily phosphohydrolase (DUF442 family)
VKLGVFLFFWLCFGFAIGTVTLLYPVRWWATFCRERGFSSGFESGGVVTLIIILVAVSMSCALWASTTWVRTRSIALKLFMPVVIAGLAYYAYSFWINPESMQANMSEDVQASQQFTFGPFPDQAKLEQLKAEGYTAVISLLHPAVVPFEPQLIRREEEEAKAAGIELLHLPMLPWVSDNADSIAKLRELAEKKEGRYYIHCYLGTDRVNVARRIIEQASGGEVVVDSTASNRRLLADRTHLERGDIYRLEGDVFLIPYPTDEEFLAYILSGQINHVIALLDPSTGDSKWIDKEKALLDQYAMPFDVFPLSSRNYDPAIVMDAVAKAKSAKKPVAVHSFLSMSTGKSPMAEAFLQGYVTGKPPIPPTLFSSRVGAGASEVVAANVAVGPQPGTLESFSALHSSGVRVVIFAGPEDAAPPEHRDGATEAGLEWKAIENPEAVVDLVGGGGPYYVYGPAMTLVKERVASRYGPAVPPVKRNAS